MTDSGTSAKPIRSNGSVLYGSGSAVGSPFRYCGAAGAQTSPDTGLILMGYRWYDPAIGRFLTPDPAGAGDNPYAYAGNNPISSLDPLGLQASDSTGGFSISDVDGTLIAAGGALLATYGDQIWNGAKDLYHDIFGGGGHHESSPSRPSLGLSTSSFFHELSAGVRYIAMLNSDPAVMAGNAMGEFNMGMEGLRQHQQQQQQMGAAEEEEDEDIFEALGIDANLDWRFHYSPSGNLHLDPKGIVPGPGAVGVSVTDMLPLPGTDDILAGLINRPVSFAYPINVTDLDVLFNGPGFGGASDEIILGGIPHGLIHPPIPLHR